MAIPKKLLSLYNRIPATTGCKQCGGCCGTVAMLESEYKAAWAWAKQYGYTPNPNPLDCIFLHPKKQKCQVYQVRPFMCRIYGTITHTRKGYCVACENGCKPMSGSKEVLCHALFQSYVHMQMANGLIEDAYFFRHGLANVKELQRRAEAQAGSPSV